MRYVTSLVAAHSGGPLLVLFHPDALALGWMGLYFLIFDVVIVSDERNIGPEQVIDSLIIVCAWMWGKVCCTVL